jgi:hypothetical protein
MYNHLKRWKHPECYLGKQWPEYYAVLGQHRGSKALDRSNFASMLKALGGESETVRVVRESHWAVGWVEWIGIHQSDTEHLAQADALMAGLDDYPVLDEMHYSEVETAEANEVWHNCYQPKDRVEYIRKHRSEFVFHNLRDVLGCVRGNYFAGYASELLS